MEYCDVDVWFADGESNTRYDGCKQIISGCEAACVGSVWSILDVLEREN